ncbi:6-phospho-beta-glucosidase [Photobacterium sp. DNB23_23_1]
MIEKAIKVVAIGGGSSYTPELVDGFIKRYNELPVGEIWLVDIPEGEEKLNIIYDLSKRMIAKSGYDIKLYKSLNRREALKGTDFVINQFRVGQNDARSKDEKIPLSHGVLGQETNGAGGLFNALRTIPVVFSIIDDIKEVCPECWVINFSNPSGLVTEAVHRYTDYKRFIGVCNIPVGMRMFAKDILGYEQESDISMDVFGINHMIFMSDFYINGSSKMAELLSATTEDMSKQTPAVRNISDLPYNTDFIKSLKLLPCPYYRYYSKEKEMLAIEMGEYYEGQTRSDVVKEVERELFEIYQDLSVDIKPKKLEERGGAYYSDSACELISSIVNDKNDEHYVNIPNNGHITNIPDDWVIEVTCNVGQCGPVPSPRIRQFDDKVLGIISALKSYELYTAKASVSGDYHDLILAMNLNPLVHSDVDAKRLVNELLIAHKDNLPQFKPVIDSYNN